MCLLLILLLSRADPVLVIDEILFAPRGGHSEFVELFNASSSPVELAGWTLYDARRRPVAIPATVRVPADGRVVLVENPAAFASDFPGVAYVVVSPWPALNNDADLVGVSSPAGVSEEVLYAGDWGVAGRSIERRDPSGPAGHRVNWSASVDPSGATPGARNSVFAPDRTPPLLLLADRIGIDSVRVEFDEPVLDVAASSCLLNGQRAASARLSRDRYTLHLASVTAATHIEIAHVSDLFGNTAIALQAPVARTPETGELVVTEVLFDPLQDPYDGRPDQPGFVELMNRSTSWITLRQISVAGAARDDGQDNRASIGHAPSAVSPGGRAVLVDGRFGPDLLESAFSTVALENVRAVSRLPVARGSGTFRVLAPTGSVVTRATYAASWHDPSFGTARGRSLERIEPWSDAEGPSAWTTARHEAGATPGTPYEATLSPRGRPMMPRTVVINEILYAPDGGQAEFVEIASIAADPVDLHGAWLQIGSDSVRIGFRPTAWPPAALAVVAPGEPDPAAVLGRAFAGPIAWALSTSGGAPLRNEGGPVVLRRADGLLVDSVYYHPTWHHPGIADPRGRSLERLDPWGPSNHSSNWTTSLDPEGATPGRPNGGGQTGPASATPSSLSVSPRVFDPTTGESTRIAADFFPGAGLFTVRVFDLSGRPIRNLVDREASHGPIQSYWNGLDDRGRPLRPGVFLVYVEVRSESGDVRSGREVVILASRPN